LLKCFVYFAKQTTCEFSAAVFIRPYPVEAVLFCERQDTYLLNTKVCFREKTHFVENVDGDKLNGLGSNRLSYIET